MTSPSPNHCNGNTPRMLVKDPLAPEHLFDVQGLVVVITGGGTGIGRMMAAALENNGATVYIVGRRLDVLQTTAREISKHGKIIPLEGDVTDRESLLSLADAVKKRHGYIDLLVNNAGIARNLHNHPLPSPGDSFSISNPDSPGPSVPCIKSFQAALWGDDESSDDFAETFLTNVTSVYYTTVAFLDLLHQGNIRKHENSVSMGMDRWRPPYHSSQVISVSSSGGFRLDSKILSTSYTLAKAACTHLGKLLANLLAPWGIRSNILAPGVFPSEMTSSIFPGVGLGPATFIDSVPLKRAGTEEEMAGAILFLASRAGAYVSGAVWLVDGGRVGNVPNSY
ncbi:2OG-Fe oxygenase [Mycena sanguinolenta]|uniref:2OG-Fe oxygenase n=1 Tax=Mycena sanguinolenta TaxID=230812 RepID=A0A8H6YAJ7_9AGAR|nr:2OG-Fe oxygenase [Mycena sanguinolenta]